MIYKAPKSQKESWRIGWWTLGGRKGWLKVVASEGSQVTSEVAKTDEFEELRKIKFSVQKHEKNENQRRAERRSWTDVV